MSKGTARNSIKHARSNPSYKTVARWTSESTDCYIQKYKEAEHGRVRDLMNQIESHPHRTDLQADLTQNNVHDLFSEKSKKMIHDTGNVEHFELCEIDSRIQCAYCLSYWAKGIVYCTCGICLGHSEDVRRLNRKRFDALSVSNYVIKKECTHGARHGKSEEQIYYH